MIIACPCVPLYYVACFVIVCVCVRVNLVRCACVCDSSSVAAASPPLAANDVASAARATLVAHFSPRVCACVCGGCITLTSLCLPL